MAQANVQRANDYIDTLRLGSYVDAPIQAPATGKNSIGKTSKLAANTEILMRRILDPNIPDTPSKYKLYVSPASSQLGVNVKNSSVGTTEAARKLFEQGYIFMVPLNYFVKLEDLAQLLARHAQKNKATTTRSWLVGLLAMVDPNVLATNNNFSKLFIGTTNPGGLDAAVNLIDSMSGSVEAVKVPQAVLNQRALANITNAMMYVNARKATPVRKNASTLTVNDLQQLERLHPASINRSKTLVEKLQLKLQDIQKATAMGGFAKKYSIKINTTTTSGQTNQTVTVTSGEGKHEVGRKVTKSGKERWTVLLGSFNNNNVYLTIGNEIANDTQVLNQLAVQVGGLFQNLPASLAQVKTQVAQGSVQASAQGYSQTPAQIATDNQREALEAAMRAQQASQSLPVPGQSFQQSAFVPPPSQPAFTQQQFSQSPPPVFAQPQSGAVEFGGVQPAFTQPVELGEGEGSDVFDSDDYSNVPPSDFSSIPANQLSFNPLEQGQFQPEQPEFPQGQFQQGLAQPELPQGEFEM